MSRRNLIAVADLSGQRSACPVQDGQISAFSCHPRIARQPRSPKAPELATSRRSGVEGHRITAPSMVSEKEGRGGRGRAALMWMRHWPPGDGPPQCRADGGVGGGDGVADHGEGLDRVARRGFAMQHSCPYPQRTRAVPSGRASNYAISLGRGRCWGPLIALFDSGTMVMADDPVVEAVASSSPPTQ